MSEELVRAFTAKGAGFLRELIAPIGVTAPGDPTPKELSFAGLWDTGATGCAITKKVAEENREMFVKIACCYIIDHQTFHQFNDTFTIITRYDEPIKMDRTGEGVRSRSTREKDLRGDRK